MSTNEENNNQEYEILNENFKDPDYSFKVIVLGNSGN
jgi:hypothetical protein